MNRISADFAEKREYAAGERCPFRLGVLENKHAAIGFRLVLQLSQGYDLRMIPPVVNLFEYADFRRFLSDYQAKRQEEDATYTRARLCKNLGLPNTRSYFNDIVKGSKPLTKNYVERFVRSFRMDEDEKRYFRILVDFGQTEDAVDRDLLFDQLIALNRTPRKFVDPEQYEYYRHWHHTAVFSVLDVHDFRGDFQDLAKRVYPAITPGQARESIGLLERLGLIQRREDGAWKATDRTLDAGPYVKDALVKQYQLQCLDLAKRTMLLANGPKGTNNFSTVTLSVSADGFLKIEKELQKFKSRVRAIAHKELVPADRVYQLNIQYFPQSNLELAGQGRYA